MRYKNTTQSPHVMFLQIVTFSFSYTQEYYSSPFEPGWDSITGHANVTANDVLTKIKIRLIPRTPGATMFVRNLNVELCLGEL